MGIGRGVGTTHLSVMFANYLANGRRKKVAILELNRNCIFSEFIHFDSLTGTRNCREIRSSNRNSNWSNTADNICNSYNNFMRDVNSTGVSSCFEIKGIDFYRNISESGISKIIAEKYDYIIFDVSGNYLLGRKEFLRSDKKIIVGSLSRWRAHEYYNYFEKAYEEMKGENCHFLTLAGDRKLSGKIRNSYGADIRQIPFEKDPFYLSGSNMKWIEEILK